MGDRRVIAPDVRIEDVDPLGFAWLCELASRRQQRDLPWLWIRHRGGRLTGSVPDAAATDPRLRAMDLTAAEAPAAILGWYDHPRVVLIDENMVDALGAELDAAAEPNLDQLALFGRCKELFWRSAAVTTAPSAPRAAAGWSTVRGVLGARDMVMAIVVMDAERVHLALRAEVGKGLVQRITTPALHSATGTELERAVAAIDAPGPAEVLLVTSRETVEDAFQADDLAGHLLDRVREDRGPQRGLEVFAA